jgi:protease-4
VHDLRSTAVPTAIALGAAGAAAAATGLRVGDFGPADVLRLAREVRRGPVVLTLDLTRTLRAEDATGLTALRTRHRPTLRDVVDGLLHAAQDDRVVGLIGRTGGTIGGLATVQEIADAVRAFRATGKPAVAHAQSFGEFTNGTLSYLLATAFGEIHLQSSGDLTLLGVSSEVTFLRGALDKAGIDPQFRHRHEYKNAADMLTERGFTPAHREALEAVVDSWATQITGAIAAGRGIDVAAVHDAIDTAPLAADEALDRGLVDRLAYHDETLDDIRGRVTSEAELLPLSDYLSSQRSRRRWHARRAPIVALVDARGPVTQRRRTGPLTGPGVSSDMLGAVLRRAAQDDDVAAVLLHVDSPGGSAVASDSIRRAVHETRRAGTPVVAWMGDVAASGGYYIAMAADRIVAQPGTLTGSIGVVAGKAVTTQLQDKLGLETEAVTRGANARFLSQATGFSSNERARLDALLDRIYDDFTAKVAHDRGLTREHVHEIARGRIWTGAQAHELGLVDDLGGYPAAQGAVRAALGLPDDAPLRLHPYPPPQSLPDRVRGKDLVDPAEQDVAAVVSALVGDPGTLLDMVQHLAQPAGVLAMPFVPRLR